tara:strand:- start:25535 stop:25750 length:216 start_codon:yes stop_codon:yes gene_type:complete
MNWKEYLISEGYMYSESNDDYRKGLGFGRSMKVSMIMKGLFEIRKNSEIKFSHYITSFEEFKNQLNKAEQS